MLKFCKWLGYENKFMTYVWFIWFLVTIALIAPCVYKIIEKLILNAL